MIEQNESEYLTIFDPFEILYKTYIERKSYTVI